MPKKSAWIRGPTEPDPNAIEGAGCGDVEVVSLAAAEGEVRCDLRQPEFADQRTVRVVAVQAIVSGAPKATEVIKSNPVIALVIGAEKVAAAQFPMINIEHSDAMQFAVDDEQSAFIGRKSQAVGLGKVFGYRGQIVVVRIQTVDVAGADLRCCFVSLVIGTNPIGRVGEPERSVRVLYHIVRAVQPASLVGPGQHLDGSVMLHSRDPPLTFFPGPDPSLPVHRTAIGEAGLRYEDIGTFADFVIAEHTIIRDVAEQHKAPSRVICRPFEPTTTGEED